ncbi:MAG: HNH endonuclease [Rummeliibacillus sp.]
MRELAQKITAKGEGSTGEVPNEIKLTKEQLSTKPPYSRDSKKWRDKGGHIEINKEGIWTYIDWDIPPNHVSYPGGFPDFKSAGLVKQEIELDRFEGRNKDFAEANKRTTISDDSTWHHHQNGTTLQEVNTLLHSRFTHKGGISLSKKK